MLLVRAIIRPEKVNGVLEALMAQGFPAVTRMNVSGRGKQRGIKIGDITYDEILKEMLMIVIPDADRELLVKIIMKEARTGTQGAYGDGKIFISPVEEVYTISSGVREGVVGAEGEKV